MLLGLGPLVGVPLNLGAFVSVPSVIPVTPVLVSPPIDVYEYPELDDAGGIRQISDALA